MADAFNAEGMAREKAARLNAERSSQEFSVVRYVPQSTPASPALSPGVVTREHRNAVLDAMGLDWEISVAIARTGAPERLAKLLATREAAAYQQGLSAGRAEAKGQPSDVDVQLDRMAAKVDPYIEKARAAESHAKAAGEALAKSKSDHQATRDKLQSTWDKLQRVKANVVGLNERVASLTSERDGLKGEVAHILAEVSSMASGWEALSRQCENGSRGGYVAGEGAAYGVAAEALRRLLARPKHIAKQAPAAEGQTSVAYWERTEHECRSSDGITCDLCQSDMTPGSAHTEPPQPSAKVTG